jgi:hypothetical protein
VRFDPRQEEACAAMALSPLGELASFNREMPPDRQPHAKGSGALGYFLVTQGVRAYTKAAVFQPGARTGPLARFSAVINGKGWGTAAIAGEKTPDRNRSVSAGCFCCDGVARYASLTCA